MGVFGVMGGQVWRQEVRCWKFFFDFGKAGTTHMNSLSARDGQPSR